MLFRQGSVEWMVLLEVVTVERTVMQLCYLQQHPEIYFSKNMALVCKATPLLNITPVRAQKDEAVFISNAMLLPCCMNTWCSKSSASASLSNVF